MSIERGYHGPLCSCYQCQYEKAAMQRALYAKSDADLLREERAAHAQTKQKLADIQLLVKEAIAMAGQKTKLHSNFAVTIDENGKARIAKGPGRKTSVSTKIAMRKSKRVTVKKRSVK